MAGMSVSTGLVSGIDYDTMINQLMQVEANPQTLLKQQLSATKSDAVAYRALNTRFDALRTAAAALSTDATWTASKVTSSSSNVTVSGSATAVAGTGITFAVSQLAGTHSIISNSKWSARTAPVRDQDPVWPITIKNTATGAATQVDVGPTGTLADAAAAINAAKAGVTASVIQLASNEFRLQLTTTTGGAAGTFEVVSSPRSDGTAAAGFTVTETGQNAQLVLGEDLIANSATNTFTELLPGVTITTTTADPDTFVKVAVASDPGAVADKVQSLVTAANGLLDAISSYTDADSAAAVLKGDSTLRGLANQVLSLVSSGITGVGADGKTVSASALGIALSKDGRLTFKAETFTAKLASDPTLVRDLFSKKSVTSSGADGIAGNADDVTSPVGLAAKLESLAKSASDATTGSLTLLAKSQDDTAKDLQARIDDWDLRLALRKDTLTRQFTAMETALGTLQNQSSWLSSQLAGLPSWSSSSK